MKTPKDEAVKAPTIGDRLLTLGEAAEVLRLNPRTVREYIQRGEIEGRIIVGRWRFRRADLETLSLRTRPVTGILLERTITGIRRWTGDNNSAGRTVIS